MLQTHTERRGAMREIKRLWKGLPSSHEPGLLKIVETTYDMQFAKAQREWSLTWASSQHSEGERTALRASIRVLAPESETARPIPSDFPLN